MIEYMRRIFTQYIKILTCKPNFIYLEGLYQMSVNRNINVINIKYKDTIPMICGLIKF